MPDVPDIPSYLDEAPEGEPPDPPTDTAAQLLPFHQLLWENFERLCLRLVRREGNPEHVQLFGTRGQSQSGIDIYSRLAGGDYATYQCKRLEEVGESDIRNAVSKFLDNEWAKTSKRFVLCTSKRLVRTELATAVEAQAKRLREHTPSIAFDVWEAEILSEKLKAQPQLVEDFFSRPWLERFSRAEVQARVDERLDEAIGLLRSYQRVRVVTLGWAPERLKRALEELETNDNELFAKLTEQVGNPPGAALVAATIAQPPAWAIEANGELWEALARIAENGGEWKAASAAWEAAAERQEQPRKVGSLVAAGVAAGVGGDAARRDALLGRAREMDDAHPRVRLVDISDLDSPRDQLAALEQIETDDPDELTLVAGRMALASLLLPDLDRARKHLVVAQQHGSGTAIAQAVAANLKVQAGRLDVLEQRPQNAPALREAHRDALNLRDRLLRERRWEESSRLLMIAADAICLLGERKEAADLLRQAETAELDAPQGAVVLADSAATRALDFRLAREFIEHAPDGPEARRIRAEALEEIGTIAERTEALRTLEELVEQGESEASEAAFIRLTATLGRRRTPWSDIAEQYLIENDHVRPAAIAKAMYRARWRADYDGAMEVLDPYLDSMWAKTTRLRLAMQRGYWPLIREAAEDVLAAGPAQPMRVEVGRAFGLCLDFERAREELLVPARDPAAPPLTRAAAYQLLMDAVGNRLGDWPFAKQLLDEWMELRPGDPQASAWAPRVANKSRPR